MLTVSNRSANHTFKLEVPPLACSTETFIQAHRYEAVTSAPVSIHFGDISAPPSPAPAGLAAQPPTLDFGGRSTTIEPSGSDSRRPDGVDAGPSNGASTSTVTENGLRSSEALNAPAAAFTQHEGVTANRNAPAGTVNGNGPEMQGDSRGAAGESSWQAGSRTEDLSKPQDRGMDGTVHESERSQASRLGASTSRENDHVVSEAGGTAPMSADGAAGTRGLSFTKTYPGEFILAQLLFWHRNTPRFDPVAALGEELRGTCLLPDPESVTQPAVPGERDTWLRGLKTDPGAAWPTQWKFKEGVLQVRRGACFAD